MQELLARADELVRRWAIALIVARPLVQMAEVPLEHLAREAPELCTLLVRALASDAELEQLLGSAASGADSGAEMPRRLSALAGARGASATAEGVEALRGVVWQAALEELRDASTRQVADLADRLAFVCASLLAAALAGQEPVGAGHVADSPGHEGRARVLYSSAQAASGGRGAVLIDERQEAALPPRRESLQSTPASAYEPARVAHEPVPAGAGTRVEQGGTEKRPPAAPRARPWDIPLDAEPRSPQARIVDGVQPSGGAPDGDDAVLRVTRGPGARVDGRA